MGNIYAVTESGSVYEIRTQGNPEVTKVYSARQSCVPVGTTLEKGDHVGLTTYGVVTYRTERDDNGGPLAAEMVNTRCHLEKTSQIVGLFADLETAQACAREDNLVPIDPRWIGETARVLSIDHPRVIADCIFAVEVGKVAERLEFFEEK